MQPGAGTRRVPSTDKRMLPGVLWAPPTGVVVNLVLVVVQVLLCVRVGCMSS
jgi:hypothetical protein